MMMMMMRRIDTGIGLRHQIVICWSVWVGKNLEKKRKEEKKKRKEKKRKEKKRKEEKKKERERKEKKRKEKKSKKAKKIKNWIRSLSESNLETPIFQVFFGVRALSHFIRFENSGC